MIKDALAKSKLEEERVPLTYSSNVEGSPCVQQIVTHFQANSTENTQGNGSVVKAPAIRTDNLNSLPGTHIAGKNLLPQRVL